MADVLTGPARLASIHHQSATDVDSLAGHLAGRVTGQVHRQRSDVLRLEPAARKWRQKEETSEWYWATTLSQRQLSTRQVWQAGHRRWEEENDCFNTLSMPWGLDHCFKHEPTAIVNFVLTLFLASVLLSWFWQRNVKAALRAKIRTLLGLAEEFRRSLGARVRVPWYPQLARAP